MSFLAGFFSIWIGLALTFVPLSGEAPAWVSPIGMFYAGMGWTLLNMKDDKI